MAAGKIVYDGIRRVINGKAVFMRQSLQYEQVYELVEERLKDREFRETLNSYHNNCNRKKGENAHDTGSRIKEADGSGMLGELTEEGWEYLFDEIFSRKIARCLMEREDPVCQMYMLPVSENGIEKTVDVTGYLLYAILYNKRCRERLWAEIPDGDDYYDYYGQSSYCDWALEEGMKAEEIWDARVLTGLLEKMRQEERGGDAYGLLMRIIYAGYEGLRQWMEGKHVVTGNEIKVHVFAAHSEEYSMLYCISEIVTAMVIAQDIGVEICFDYEMLVLLHFMEAGEKEMREGSYGVQESGRMGNEEFGKFLKKFRGKYGTDSSLEALVFRSETKRMDRLLLGVMAQYHISPRMFCGMDLTEEEVRALQGLDDKWTEKSYWSMLVIAHLCKYIGEQKGNHFVKRKV